MGPMTDPEVPRPPVEALSIADQERAFQLYLGGFGPAAIARALNARGAAVTEVEAMVAEAPVGRELELARIDQLWQKHYTTALDDEDPDSLAACLKLMNARTQVMQRMRQPLRKAPGGEVDKSQHGTPEDIRNAWRRLAGGANIAAEALIEVAQYGRSDFARVNAATAILDRIGLGTSQEVTVRAMPAEFDQAAAVDTHISPAQVIRNRMKLLASQTPVAPGDEVLDAEIVADEVSG